MKDTLDCCSSSNQPSLNIRSILQPLHSAALCDLINSHHPDLFCLTETWIKPTTTFTELKDTAHLLTTLFWVFLELIPTFLLRPLAVILAFLSANLSLSYLHLFLTFLRLNHPMLLSNCSTQNHQSVTFIVVHCFNRYWWRTHWAVVQVDSTDTVHLKCQTMTFLVFTSGHASASASILLNLRPRPNTWDWDQDRDQTTRDQHRDREHCKLAWRPRPGLET